MKSSMLTYNSETRDVNPFTVTKAQNIYESLKLNDRSRKDVYPQNKYLLIVLPMFKSRGTRIYLKCQ